MSNYEAALLRGFTYEEMDPRWVPELAWAELVLEDHTGLAQVNDLRLPPPEGSKNKTKRVVSYWVPPMRQQRSSTSTKTGPIESLKGMGFAAGAAKSGKKMQPKLRESFIKTWEDCRDAISSKAAINAIEALLAFLRNTKQTPAQQILNYFPWVEGDIEKLPVSTFMLIRYRNKYLHSYADVIDHFCRHIFTPAGEPDGRPCCFTGKPIQVAVPQNKMPGVIGSNKLYSVKKDIKPYHSYSKVGLDNCPTEWSTTLNITSYIARLCSSTCADPKNRNRLLPNRSTWLGNGTRIMYWGVTEEADDTAEILSGLANNAASMFTEGLPPVVRDESERVGLILDSVWKRGAPRHQAPSHEFYTLTMTESGKRLAVTDFTESTVADIQANVAQHFADLQLDVGTDEGYIPSLGTIMAASLPPNARNAQGGWRASYPASISQQMHRAAITGTMYPSMVYQRCLQRCLQVPVTLSWASRTRLSFLQAYVRRQQRLGLNSNFKEISIMLDTENKDIGYLLGRLAYWTAEVQKIAYPYSSPAARGHYYRGLLLSPARVYEQCLTRLDQHRKKIETAGDGGLMHFCDGFITAICEDIAAEGPPGRLTAQQRIQFVQGHIHELAAERRRKRNKKNKSKK